MSENFEFGFGTISKPTGLGGRVSKLPELKLSRFLFFAAVLLASNLLLWADVAKATKPASGFYFLNVGQGDSELAIFPTGAKVITDAGPGKQVASEAQSVLGTLDSYIDIAVISHPQLDHYGGFSELLSHYDFGLFITNGREAQSGSREWNGLIQSIKNKNVPILALGAGDRIFFGPASAGQSQTGQDKIEILSPNKKLQASKELNDTALVQKVSMGAVTELLTSDIGDKVEKALLKSGIDLRADILKVAHHGSKYSSSAAFLKAVSPITAVIEVGKKNTYGHPTQAVLDRLAAIGASVFRTDISGTLNVHTENRELIVAAGSEQ